MGHDSSLGPAFAPGPLTVEGPVRPAFALALYGGFPSRLSRPLGPLDTFSRGCRPSQTAHLPLSRRAGAGKGYNRGRVVFHWRLPHPREGGFYGSHLRSASAAIPQQQAAVKLHGVFSSRWGCVDCSATRWVHRVPGGDSGALVGPFMHVGTHPTRHLATLRESELLPSFAGPYPG